MSLHGVTKQVPLNVEATGFLANTPFGDTRAGFSATAEINRDEIPVALQTYVEQYFEQVRKQQDVSRNAAETPSNSKKKN